MEQRLKRKLTKGEIIGLRKKWGLKLETTPIDDENDRKIREEAGKEYMKKYNITLD